ncbi:DUF4145 domain-containing protein [Paraburkholderia tropica]|uniref:DUF4145 domain-containing protein n=1 Tax=Paraburkholderia tropica TaxID=92647 RepID=UPI001602B819|nr:DUF4145 domain-containing protein [Paraburkholderia tropica]QNB11545.1 DUF4145 domain-containing protein [Paraburkholderia tropica]
MDKTKAHCNTCGGDRNHGIAHCEKASWSDDEYGVHGDDTYEMLKCLGCETITLRHTSWVSAEDDVRISYFPQSIFRPKPKWLDALWLELSPTDLFVYELLGEIYVALHNDLKSLAAMGVRSLIEKVMISKTGDKGTFAKNLAEFENLGFVSTKQKERIEAILDAGHATIHRDFKPALSDVITLVDMAEHIVETVYLHESKITALKKRVPPRQLKT